MENTQFKKLLKFNGDHGRLIGLRIMNNILTVITLGFYYPWAKTAYLKYLYGETEFMESRFSFHGTGKEVFIGFLKAMGLIIGLYAILIICVLSQSVGLKLLGFLIFFCAMLVIAPVAIHGSLRYRLSRTSWRGIHFGYRGNLSEFIKLYLVESLLTIITFGIYSSWMEVKVISYIRSNTRFGNVEFRFDGRGVDLFLIKLKGVLLTMITFGIYSFWYFKNLVAFQIENTKAIQNGKEINMRTTLTGGQIFGMLIINYFIVLFTLGIGTGIAINRIMREFLGSIEFDNEIDTTSLEQTEAEYKDATGDDLAGFLDISII